MMHIWLHQLKENPLKLWCSSTSHSAFCPPNFAFEQMCWRATTKLVKRTRTCSHTCPSPTSETPWFNLRTGEHARRSGRSHLSQAAFTDWLRLHRQERLPFIFSPIFLCWENVRFTERRWRRFGITPSAFSLPTSPGFKRRLRGLAEQTSWSGGGSSPLSAVKRPPWCPPRCGREKVRWCL